MAISCHQTLPPEFTLQNSLATLPELFSLSFSALGSAYDTPQGRPRYRPRMVPLWRLSCTIFSCQFSTRIFPARFSTKIFQKYFREKVNKFSKRFSKTFAVEDANDLPARGTLTLLPVLDVSLMNRLTEISSQADRPYDHDSYEDSFIYR